MEKGEDVAFAILKAPLKGWLVIRFVTIYQYFLMSVVHMIIIISTIEGRGKERGVETGGR